MTKYKGFDICVYVCVHMHVFVSMYGFILTLRLYAITLSYNRHL